MGNCITKSILRNTNQDNIKKFSLKGHKYIAKVVNVYDGDTITVLIRYRMKTHKFRVRMYGYDSPEMKPRQDDPNRYKIKEAALKAKMKLLEKIDNKIVELDCGGFDKYGRLLGTVYLRDNCCKSSININQWMINNNYGYRYNGGKKRDNITN